MILPWSIMMSEWKEDREGNDFNVTVYTREGKGGCLDSDVIVYTQREEHFFWAIYRCALQNKKGRDVFDNHVNSINNGCLAEKHISKWIINRLYDTSFKSQYGDHFLSFVGSKFQVFRRLTFWPPPIFV